MLEVMFWEEGEEEKVIKVEVEYFGKVEDQKAGTCMRIGMGMGISRDMGINLDVINDEHERSGLLKSIQGMTNLMFGF